MATIVDYDAKIKIIYLEIAELCQRDDIFRRNFTLLVKNMNKVVDLCRNLNASSKSPESFLYPETPVKEHMFIPRTMKFSRNKREKSEKLMEILELLKLYSEIGLEFAD